MQSICIHKVERMSVCRTRLASIDCGLDWMREKIELLKIVTAVVGGFSALRDHVDMPHYDKRTAEYELAHWITELKNVEKRIWLLEKAVKGED